MYSYPYQWRYNPLLMVINNGLVRKKIFRA
jgi:hypothetical protein